MEHVYGNLGGAWRKDQYASQLARFPEGQIVIEDNGQIVAAALSMIVDYARFGDVHTYAQITGDGYLTHHDPMGDTLYGVDSFVPPKYRGQRLGRRLYDASKKLCRNLNLRRFIVGGRIPGYAQYADMLNPVCYIEEVKNRKIFDPVLTFLWRLPVASGTYRMQRIWTFNTHKRLFLAPVIFNFHMMPYWRKPLPIPK